MYFQSCLPGEVEQQKLQQQKLLHITSVMPACVKVQALRNAVVRQKCLGDYNHQQQRVSTAQTQAISLEL